MKITNAVGAILWFVLITLINAFLMPIFADIVTGQGDPTWDAASGAFIIVWIVFSEFAVTYLIATAKEGESGATG